MNGDKAKNIIIVIFLVINMFLAFLTFKDDRKYYLSNNSLENIDSILNAYNIKLDNNNLIKVFKPLRKLKGQTGNILDKNFIIDSIAQDKNNLDFIITNSESESYKNSLEEFYFNQGSFTYDNYQGININEDNLDFCNNILKKLNDYTKNFVLDTVIEVNGKTIIQYREKLKNYYIYDNYLNFYIENEKLKKIEFNYDNIGSFEGSKRDISYVQEVILTFLHNIENKNSTINIERIDIVYAPMINKDSSESKRIILLPFYRFNYYETYLGNKVYNSLLINAYTNNIKSIGTIK